jgi:hypothetical protein
MPSLGVSSLDLTALFERGSFLSHGMPLQSVAFVVGRKIRQIGLLSLKIRLFGRKRQALAAAGDF